MTLLCLLALASCTRRDPDVPGPAEPGTATLKVSFEPYWGAVPFNKNNVYPDDLGHRVQVQQVKFYVGELKLTGTTVRQLSEIDLMNLTNGPVERTFSVQPGMMDGIAFGIGVPAHLNQTDPVLYPIDHPLSVNQGMYWTWATMYRFIIFEGRFDNDVAAVGTPPFQFSIHTGIDTCYRTLALARSMDLVEDGQYVLRLKVDLRSFLDGNPDNLDLSVSNQAHGSPEELPIALLLSDNARNAISLMP